MENLSGNRPLAMRTTPETCKIAADYCKKRGDVTKMAQLNYVARSNKAIECHTCKRKQEKNHPYFWRTTATGPIFFCETCKPSFLEEGGVALVRAVQQCREELDVLSRGCGTNETPVELLVDRLEDLGQKVEVCAELCARFSARYKKAEKEFAYEHVEEARHGLEVFAKSVLEQVKANKKLLDREKLCRVIAGLKTGFPA